MSPKKLRRHSLPRSTRRRKGNLCPLNQHSGFSRVGEELPPPLDILDFIAGYEALGFDSVPPPSDATQTPMREISLPPPPAVTILSEATARAALLSHVKDQCCWDSRPARTMPFTHITHSPAFHYLLETFSEKREARWAWVPHAGGEVDGPDGGVAPGAWDIPACPASLFASEVKCMEVPHTASVKACHRCRAAGSLPCPACHAKGWTRCIGCCGDGVLSDGRDRCLVCGTSSHGHGRADCGRCGAKGRLSCPACDAHGQLKLFIQLSISW